MYVVFYILEFDSGMEIFSEFDEAYNRAYHLKKEYGENEHIVMGLFYEVEVN